MGAPLGRDDYRHGALTRLEDARRLRDSGRWVCAVYLAGRAVEGMCRSLLWQRGLEQGVSHDLRDLLRKAGYLQATIEKEDDGTINEFAAVWFNNLRFAGEDYFLRHLKSLGCYRRVKGDTAKYVAKRLVDTGEKVVSTLDSKWRRSKTN